MACAVNTLFVNTLHWTRPAEWQVVHHYDIYRLTANATGSLTTASIVGKVGLGQDHFVDVVTAVAGYWYWIKGISWSEKSSVFSLGITAIVTSPSISLPSLSVGDLTVTSSFDLPDDTVSAGEGYLRWSTTDAEPQYGDGTSWHYLGSPKYIYMSTSAAAEGDIHISDTANWNSNKALIKSIRVNTTSNHWDLWLLQNDNGYAVDDATIPRVQLMDGGNGNESIYPDLAYEDEDASGEIHLYFNDVTGAATADIFVQGYQLK
jgi:hypothetical protein